MGASGCPISPNISFIADTDLDISFSFSDILLASISRIFVSSSGREDASPTVMFMSFAICSKALDLGEDDPMRPFRFITSYISPALPAVIPPICETSFPSPYRFSNTLLVIAPTLLGSMPLLPVTGSVAYLAPINIF